MKTQLSFFSILFSFLLFFGCSSSSSSDEEEILNIEIAEKDVFITVSATAYNHSNNEWQGTDATIVITGDGIEIINQELTSDVKSIKLPLNYEEYIVTISKGGNDTSINAFSKEEIKAYENSSLIIQLIERVYEGSIIIDTIEKYNDFISGNYASVTDDFIITEVEELINIDELNTLTSVGGELKFLMLNNLNNINGLINITDIGKGLSIYNNILLENLEGLINIKSLGGDLWVQGNDSLTNLEGLNNITSVGGALEIFYNANLTSLNGLNNLASIENDIIISGNYLIASISALNSLTTIQARLQISGCNYLNNLNGLNNITSVAGTLEISGNHINTLEGIDNIMSVGYGLEIYNNSFLANWCSIKTLLTNDGVTGGYLFSNCLFTPTVEEIINGDCTYL